MHVMKSFHILEQFVNIQFKPALNKSKYSGILEAYHSTFHSTFKSCLIK